MKPTLRWLWFLLAAAAYLVFLSQLDTSARFLLSLGLGLAYAYERFTDSTLRPAAFFGLASLLAVGSFSYSGVEALTRVWPSNGSPAPEAAVVGLILGLIVAVVFAVRVVRPGSREAGLRSRVFVGLVLATVAMLIFADIFRAL